MTESDRLSVYTLARIRMLEAIMLRLLATTLEPARSAVKELARRYADTQESESLYRPISDEELSITELGREHTFRAVFGESR